MNRIGLKINGIWCVLPQDVSISIEEQNPLFSDSGSFSYPIEMSVSQNRELFKSIDSPHGRIRPQDLDGLPFELWYDGVMLFYGSTETDEDLDIEEDKCSINLVSGNGNFQSKIEGMQCTDVPLLDEIELGYYYPGLSGRARDTDTQHNGGLTDPFDEPIASSSNMDFTECNVSEPYPLKPYCNIRVCVQRNNEWGNWDEQPYYVVEADRPWSGLCFYVAYFFKCLFSYLGYVVRDEDNHMCDVEDMNRLAFVSTKCEHRLGKEEDLGRVEEVKAGKYVHAWLEKDDAYVVMNNVVRRKVYATEKNFPETDVSSLVESMFNAFGLKIITDLKSNNLSIVYIRDILRDNEVLNIPIKVKSLSISYSKIKGVKMTYGGDDKDTAYNYNGFEGDIVLVDSYSDLIKRNLSPYDKRLYVDVATGNKYRIKIDEDAEKEGDVKNLNPVLFEVSQYSDYILGQDGDGVEELKISFTPLIENDTYFRKSRYSDEINEQCLALYVDGALVNAPGVVAEKIMGDTDRFFGIKVGDWSLTFKQNVLVNYVEEKEEDPIRSFDTGFMLGVMRGGGSNSGYAITKENYDGNGNSAYVIVSSNYAFSSDSIDAYGNHYDYNGIGSGVGYKDKDLISLKTHIQTSKDVGLADKDGNDAWGINGDAAKRGLADRFMSEYMYFLLHRKTVKMDVDTTLSQLTSLSWFKQLRISDTVGRLKSRSYTLTNSGVTDMSIELYTIN